MASKSISQLDHIEDLASQSNPLNTDMFLISRGDNLSYSIKWQTLYTYIYKQVEQLIPKTTVNDYLIKYSQDISIVNYKKPSNTSDEKIYTCNAITQICNNIYNRLDTQTDTFLNKNTTDSQQIVEGPVSFSNIPTTYTSNGNNLYEVATVGYVNSKFGYGPTTLLTSFSGYGIATNTINDLNDYIPTPKNPYTASETCFISYNINWDCGGADGYACYVKSTDGNQFMIAGLPPIESNGTALLEFYGSFVLKAGYQMWFDSFPSMSIHGTNVSYQNVVRLLRAYITVSHMG